MSTTEYYNILNGLWFELDYYQSIKMKCSEDTAMLLKFMERERIYEFLARLNAEFDQVRVQVLGKEKVPSLSEVFSIIRVISVLLFNGKFVNFKHCTEIPG